MTTNQQQTALAVLETLIQDLMYGRLNNGSGALEVADLREYVLEEIYRIRTSGPMTELRGNQSVHEQNIPQVKGRKARI
jgi:hypothetical protein